MPWVESQTQSFGLSPAGQQPEDAIAVPSRPLQATWNALFENDNTLGSVGRWAGQAWERAQFDDVPDYDPFVDLGTYRQWADRFVASNSPGESMAIKRQIDREQHNKEVIAESGWTGAALSVAVAILDPVNLLPIGGSLAGVRTASGSIARGVGGGVVAGLSTEAALQATQETRSFEETALNIGGAALLGGVLGGAVGAFQGSRVKAMADLEDALTGGRSAGAPGSLSAAAVRDLRGNELAPAFGAERLQTMPVVGSPLARSLTSESPVVRDLTERLAENPMVQAKNLEGRATALAAETGAKLWQFNLYKGVMALEDAFTRYRTGAGPGFGTATRLAAADMVGATGGKLRYREFSSEVGKALRRNDDHSIPEVAAAAKAIRREFFEPQRKAMVDLDFIGEDHEVTTALSYYMRVYDIPKIIAERTAPGGFEERLVGGLQRKQVRAISEYETAQARAIKYGTAAAELQDRVKTYDPVERKSREKAARVLLPELRRRQSDVDRAEFNKRIFDEFGTQSDPANAEVPQWLKTEIRAIREGWKPRKPEGLTSYLVKSGGLRTKLPDGTPAPYAGEIERLFKGGRVGAINNKAGQTLDDAALRAWQEGFIGVPGGDRPDIDEFLAALDDDVGGAGVYRASDQDILDAAEGRRQIAKAIDRAGLDLNKVTDAEVAETVIGDFMARSGGNIDERVAVATKRHREQLAKVDEARALARDYGTLPRLQKKLASAIYKRDLAESNVEAWRFLATAEERDLQDMSRQIADRIVGNDRGTLSGLPDFLEVNKRGALADRTLTIVNDDEIEDFLISDVDQVLRHSIRSSAPDIEIARQFGRPDMGDAVDRINEDFARLREAVRGDNAMTEAQKAKRNIELQKDQAQSLNDLRDMRDRIRGTYGVPDNPEALGWRALRVLKQVNHVTLMGSAAVPSSLSDIARSIFQHGFGRVFGDGLVPMIRNWNTIRLTADEYRLGGAAMELTLDSRLSAMSDLNQAYNPRTRFEQGMENVVRKFNVLNIMAPWTQGLQFFEGIIAQKRILDSVEKLATGKAIVQRDVRYLAESGIDEAMARRMYAERSQWVETDGLRQGNARKWGDQEAARTFMGAMGKSQRTAIVEPGQDKPLWMSSALGSVVGQFRSYTMSSTARVMVLGLQRRDASALSGVASMIAMGMMAYYFQSQINTSPNARALSDDPAVWIKEGIIRSGVAGWLMDANAIIEKTSSNNIGLSALLGQPQSTRYGSRNVTGSFLGPSFGRVEDIVKMLNAVSTGNWAASDSTALRRQVPLQNLFYLRWLFDKAEQDVYAD